MSARICALLVLAFVQLSTSTAQAQWFSNFWAEYKSSYLRNKHWPEPVVQQDRMSVAAPIGMMVSKGWQRETLLCDFHFEDGTAQLNQAGEMRVKYILTEVPARHRIILVQRALTPEATSERVSSIQQTVMRLQPHAEIPPVFESNMTNVGIPAEGVDKMLQKELSSRPDPRLPAPQGDDSSSK